MSDLDVASSTGHSTAWDHHALSADGPRGSVDSGGRASASRYRDSIALAVERAGPPTPTLVEPTFDESVLRALCDLDVRARGACCAIAR
jgi:hypothetical protein